MTLKLEEDCYKRDITQKRVELFKGEIKLVLAYEELRPNNEKMINIILSLIHLYLPYNKSRRS